MKKAKTQSTRFFLSAYENGFDKHWNIVKEKDAPLIDILKTVENPENKSFLDIGCGIGKHCIIAAKLGMKSFGIDISPIAIEKFA